jgi:DNA-binding XRE family transcriptional regulator
MYEAIDFYYDGEISLSTEKENTAGNRRMELITSGQIVASFHAPIEEIYKQEGV